MALTLVTAPALEPISIEDARRHLRVDETEDDQHIAVLITAARVWAEDFTRRAFVMQTWDLKLSGFPCWIEVPKPPLISVTAASFTYLDGAGVATQVPSDVYTVDTASHPGRVYPAYGQSWPSPRPVPHSVSLRFVAGYGTAEDSVAAPIRHAIRIMVAHLYEHREPIIVGASVADVPLSVSALLLPYQINVGF